MGSFEIVKFLSHLEPKLAYVFEKDKVNPSLWSLFLEGMQFFTEGRLVFVITQRLITLNAIKYGFHRILKLQKT